MVEPVEPQRPTISQTLNDDGKAWGADPKNDHSEFQKNRQSFHLHNLPSGSHSQVSGNMEPPSLMVRKFLSSGGKGWEPDPYYDYDAFRKEFYFFYGTLMDPKTLAEALRLPMRPKIFPAKIIGYSCKLWGPYPALVDMPAGAIVHGVAYEVQSP